MKEEEEEEEEKVSEDGMCKLSERVRAMRAAAPY